MDRLERRRVDPLEGRKVTPTETQEIHSARVTHLYMYMHRAIDGCIHTCLHAEALKHAGSDMGRCTQTYITRDPPSGARSATALRFSKSHNRTCHNIPLHCITLHDTTSHCITLHDVTLHHFTVQNMPLHHIAYHYNTLHYIRATSTLHYATTATTTTTTTTLHCTTVH